MKVTLSNIRDYNVGWIRYYLYYSTKFHWLMRTHIREQIQYRIAVMNRDCYDEGSCVKCGCSTTALQMANKSCDGDCYAPMLGRREWRKEVAAMTCEEKVKYGFKLKIDSNGELGK